MLESKGQKRTIGGIFAALAALAPVISWLNPYTQVLTILAGAFGGVGVLHAGASKIAKKQGK